MDQPATIEFETNGHSTGPIPMKTFDRIVDNITGEFRDLPRQETLPGVRRGSIERPYRVQLTITTETTVRAHDEERAEEDGLADIDAGDGTIIKRQVSVSLIQAKGA